MKLEIQIETEEITHAMRLLDRQLDRIAVDQQGRVALAERVLAFAERWMAPCLPEQPRRSQVRDEDDGDPPKH